MSDVNYKGTYTATEHFAVIDTIGVPHPYCITEKHVAVASEHFSGRLGEEAIKSAEKGRVCERDGRRVEVRARCGVKGCNLSYEEHKQALLVSCKADIHVGDEVNPELKGMLEANVDEATANGYAGFAFKDDRDEQA